MDTDQLRERISAGMSRTSDELASLVRIPSIGYPGYDPAHVRASAEATRDILLGAGVTDAHLVELDGGHPAVAGQINGPKGAPTVLLYAHHDVQPEGPADQWQTPPFEPDVRDGRMYGRGSADDKAGIVVHSAALRGLGAHEGAKLPVTVKVIVEGEEECSTEHLPELVQEHRHLLEADVAVIADGGQYRNGVPTLGTSIRGLTDCIVEVRVLERAQHSGSFGGPVPDALTALCRILASLHDDLGNVAIEGLKRFTWDGMPITEDELRDESGVLPSVRMIGTGPLADQLFSGPAVSVLGIDAPRVAESSNQLVPWARARVSLRLAPGDDAKSAGDKLVAHLKAAAPWGVEVKIHPNEAGQGYMVDAASAAYKVAKEALSQAWEREVVEIGSGGSIPLVPMLVDAFPGLAVLIWGAADDTSYYHSIDESVDLVQIEVLAVAEALLIQDLAAAL